MSNLKVYHCNEWHNEYTEFHMKCDVDALLSEKDKEIEELKAQIEIEKASRYAEGVAAGIRERRMKRALWLDRAKRANEIKWHEGLEHYLQERKKWWPSRFSFMRDDEMYHVWYKCWCEVERKCIAKAEEFE